MTSVGTSVPVWMESLSGACFNPLNMNQTSSVLLAPIRHVVADAHLATASKQPDKFRSCLSALCTVANSLLAATKSQDDATVSRVLSVHETFFFLWHELLFRMPYWTSVHSECAEQLSTLRGVLLQTVESFVTVVLPRFKVSICPTTGCGVQQPQAQCPAFFPVCCMVLERFSSLAILLTRAERLDPKLLQLVWKQFLRLCSTPQAMMHLSVQQSNGNAALTRERFLPHCLIVLFDTCRACLELTDQVALDPEQQSKEQKNALKLARFWAQCLTRLAAKYPLVLADLTQPFATWIRAVSKGHSTHGSAVMDVVTFAKSLIRDTALHDAVATGRLWAHMAERQSIGLERLRGAMLMLTGSLESKMSSSCLPLETLRVTVSTCLPLVFRDVQQSDSLMVDHVASVLSQLCMACTTTAAQQPPQRQQEAINLLTTLHRELLNAALISHPLTRFVATVCWQTVFRHSHDDAHTFVLELLLNTMACHPNTASPLRRLLAALLPIAGPKALLLVAAHLHFCDRQTQSQVTQYCVPGIRFINPDLRVQLVESTPLWVFSTQNDLSARLLHGLFGPLTGKLLDTQTSLIHGNNINVVAAHSALYQLHVALTAAREAKQPVSGIWRDHPNAPAFPTQLAQFAVKLCGGVRGQPSVVATLATSLRLLAGDVSLRMPTQQLVTLLKHTAAAVPVFTELKLWTGLLEFVTACSLISPPELCDQDELYAAIVALFNAIFNDVGTADVDVRTLPTVKAFQIFAQQVSAQGMLQRLADCLPMSIQPLVHDYLRASPLRAPANDEGGWTHNARLL